MTAVRHVTVTLATEVAKDIDRSDLTLAVTAALGDLYEPESFDVDVVEATTVPGGPLPTAVHVDGRRCWFPEEDVVNFAVDAAGGRLVPGRTATLDGLGDAVLADSIVRLTVEALRTRWSSDGEGSGDVEAVLDVAAEYLDAITSVVDPEPLGMLHMRRSCYDQLGFAPPMHIRPSRQQPAATMTVGIGSYRGPTWRGVPVGKQCAILPADPLIDVPGADGALAVPGFDVPGPLIDAGSDAGEWRVVLDPFDYLALCAAADLRRWARTGIDEDIAARIVADAEYDAPLLVDVVRRRLKMADLAAAFRQLVVEGLPLGRAHDLLAAAVDAAEPEDLASAMRAGCPWRVHLALADRPHRLAVGEDLEQALETPAGVEEADAAIVAWIRRALDVDDLHQQDAHIVVPEHQRARVVGVTAGRFPRLLVIGEQESLPWPILGELGPLRAS